MIVTNKVLLPVLLSYLRAEGAGAGRRARTQTAWSRIAVLATPRVACAS
jgi:hypothetical protein